MDLVINTGLHQAGPWSLLVGVVAFVFLAMFRGWIIVKLHYDTLLARAVAAEEANEKLSARAAMLTETNAVLARANEDHTAVGATVTKLVTAIQETRTTAGGPE